MKVGCPLIPFRASSRCHSVLWTVLVIGAMLGVQLGLAHHAAAHHTCATDHQNSAPSHCTLCQAAVHLVAVQAPALDLPPAAPCTFLEISAETSPATPTFSSLQARAPPAPVVV